MRPFTVDDFDFTLPPELVAQHPAAERSGSRLLDGTGAQPVDRVFRDLPALLQPGDLLVFNDTRVIKARLHGEKTTGGAVEALVERILPGPDHAVWAHLRASKSPKPGARVRFAGGAFEAEVLGRAGPDGGLFHLRLPADPLALLEAHGHVPLPPYITHADDADDERRYQTVFAERPGAVAAPTASLHFDEAVMQALAARGVLSTRVTLHVGAGTFQPVRAQALAEHRMHSELYEVGASAVAAIAAARARGGRVVAAGTTALRALESAALASAGVVPDGIPPLPVPAQGSATDAAADTAGGAAGGAVGGAPATPFAALAPQRGETALFITPGFRFRVVDLLLTNFHLPRSTLLMLVSALAGHAPVQALYRHAVAQRYRFFSYGDAMLLARREGVPAGLPDPGSTPAPAGLPTGSPTGG